MHPTPWDPWTWGAIVIAWIALSPLSVFIVGSLIRAGRGPSSDGSA